MTDASITSPGYSSNNQAEFDDYFALLKPRVMSLVIFTASVGLFVNWPVFI
jgi:protoheme IX farnesyltransferase